MMCCLLLRKLYERLSLSRGQVAAAADLLARELLQDFRAGTPVEAVEEAARRVGLEAVHLGEYEFLVKGCGECPGEEMCPVAFYLAAAVRVAAGAAAVPLRDGERFGVKGEEGCRVRIRVYRE